MQDMKIAMGIALSKDKESKWRVVGSHGGAEYAVAHGGLVKVKVGPSVSVMPVRIALQIVPPEVRAFLGDPKVAEFLRPSVREPRIEAARALANKDHDASRAQFQAELMAHGVSESEAWDLARIKFPILSKDRRRDRPPKLTFDRYGVARRS